MANPIPSVAALEAQLVEARTAAQAAEDHYSDVAYAFSIGQCSEDELAMSRGANRAAVNRIEDLERAIAGARKAEADARAAAIAAAKALSINSLKNHLARRGKAVERMLQLADQLVDAWEEVLDRSEKIMPLVPGATTSNEGDVGLLTFGSIGNLIGARLYLSSFKQAVKADPTTPQRFAFPGSRIPPLTYVGRPDQLPSAEKEIAEANTWLLNRLGNYEGVVEPLPVEKPKALPRREAEPPAHRSDPNVIEVREAPAPELRHAPIDTPAGQEEFLRMAAPFMTAEELDNAALSVGVTAPSKAEWFAKHKRSIGKE